MKTLKLLFLLAFVALSINIFAQDDGSDCATALPFCTGTTYEFPLQTNNGSAESGPSYGCLYTRPNPVWYYLKISQAGNIDIYMESTPESYDVDFICWGPFTGPTCGTALSSSTIVDCSYSGASVETCNIPTAQVGQWYMLLITNYDNQPTNVQFYQTGGTGATDCSILNTCSITAVTATPSACDPYTNAYSVTGQVAFTEQPTTGSLTVSDNAGNFQTIDAPFNNPISYTIPNNISNGTTHTITAVFSDDIYCTGTATYSAPAMCQTCNTDAGSNSKLCGLRFDHLEAVLATGDVNTFWTCVTPGVTYDNVNSPTTAVNVSTPGTYVFTWHVTNLYGVTCSDDVSVIFDPIPTSDFTYSNINCFNTASNVVYTGTASSGAIYSWTWDGGSRIPLIASQGPYTVSWNTPGNHIVRLVVEENGCFSTPTEHTVLNPDLLTVTSTVTILPCPSSTMAVNFNVNGGTGAYLYHWTDGTASWDGAAGLLGLGSYGLTVTDAQGCTDTTTFIVTAPAPLSLLPNHTNLNCYNDHSGTAWCTVSGGTGPYTSLWVEPGLTEPAITGLAAGTYTISITDANDCSLTSSVTISQPNPLIATISAVDSTNCNGESNGSATVNISGGTSPYNCVWADLTTNMTNTALSGGSQMVAVSDSLNCTTTATTVIPEPAILTTTVGSIKTLCYASSDGVVFASASGGTAPYDYLWPQTANDTAYGFAYGTYEVTINDDHGCSVKASVLVDRPSLLTASIIESADVTCYGRYDGMGKVAAMGGTPSYTYFWWAGTAGGGNTNTVNILGPGPHTVTVTDANGCDTTATVTISQPPLLVLTQDYYTPISCFGDCDGTVGYSAIGGTDPLSFVWKNGDTGASLQNICPGDNYVLSVTDANGCLLKDSIVFLEPAQIVIESSDDAIMCEGGSYVIEVDTIEPGVEPYTFFLNGVETTNPMPVAPSFSKNYSIYLQDANGCNSEPVYTYITVIPPVEFNLVVDNDSVCEGEPVVISVVDGPTGGGGGPYAYDISWIDENKPPPYDEVPVVNSGYFIVGIMGNQCRFYKKDSVFVYVYPPAPYLVYADSTDGCVPFTTTFHEASPDFGQVFVWDFGDGTGETSTLKSPTHTYETAGNYKVTLRITTIEGCSTLNSPFSSMIVAHAIPETRFSYISENEEGPTVLEPEVHFISEIDESWHGGDLTSLWSFMYNNDGFVKDSLTDENPTYVFDRAGLWTVTLRMTSEFSCASQISSVLSVEEISNIYFPSAFLPDTYGENRSFIPKGSFKDEGYHMRIFNRWGEMVFETYDRYKVWTGALNGKVLEVGTYTYLVTYVSHANVEYTKSGTVTLIK